MPDKGFTGSIVGAFFLVVNTITFGQIGKTLRDKEIERFFWDNMDSDRAKMARLYIDTKIRQFFRRDEARDTFKRINKEDKPEETKEERDNEFLRCFNLVFREQNENSHVPLDEMIDFINGLSEAQWRYLYEFAWREYGVLQDSVGAGLDPGVPFQ